MELLAISLVLAISYAVARAVKRKVYMVTGDQATIAGLVFGVLLAMLLLSLRG